jgi:hypothetical protein
MGATTNGSTAPISPPFGKQTSWQQAPKWRLPIVILVFACSFVSYMFFSASRLATKPPLAIVISACPDVTSGSHRITSDFGIRFDAPEKAFFDAPEKAFTVHTALQDMPPGALYVGQLKNADANMTISGDDDISSNLKTAYPIFSEHVEERNVRDTTGRICGTDRWGYLPSGERWRYVRFSTRDAAGYEPTPPKQANLLDQVVNSACFSRHGILRK